MLLKLGTLGRYFASSLWISLATMGILFWITGDLRTLYVATILASLEVSLSFDNAVVNARTLERMEPIWQARFIWLGIPIAVFGMRLLFPLVLVYLTTPLSFSNVIHTALYAPTDYAHALHAGYPLISAFGSAFLFMVFFHFLFELDRPVHWLNCIEKNRQVLRASQYPFSAALCTVILGVLWMLYRPQISCAIAYFLGIVCYQMIHSGSAYFLKSAAAAGKAMKLGWAGFIYLEVLDASLSFDGVIGAFAISTHILVILVGLGIGALFVRSFTLYFVEQKTLSKLKYLEHSAYYAIGALAVIMLLKNAVEISEVVSGSVGLIFITVGIISSFSGRLGRRN